MIVIEYPDITSHEIPTINNKEVLYWLYRVFELVSPVLEFSKKLVYYYGKGKGKGKEEIGLLLSIIQRQLEITDSFILLVSKNKIRDSGLLILSMYELTLDLLYISKSGKEAIKIWLQNDKEYRKPWKITWLINELYTEKISRDAELNIYKNYSMIKHGNIAGKHIAFDVFLQNDKLILEPLDPQSSLPNIYGLGVLLYRTFESSIKIIENIGITEYNIKSDMKVMFNKFNEDMKTLLDLRLIESQYPNDTTKQKEIIDKLGLKFTKS